MEATEGKGGACVESVIGGGPRDGPGGLRSMEYERAASHVGYEMATTYEAEGDTGDAWNRGDAGLHAGRQSVSACPDLDAERVRRGQQSGSDVPVRRGDRPG